MTPQMPDKIEDGCEMTTTEVMHQILAAVITIKAMKIADREAGHIPIYLTFRPLLVSSLLYSVYRSIRVSQESRAKAQEKAQ